MGRFYQLDPNATAMALLEASIYHGRGVGAIALAFSMEDMYGDGLNLYEYLGSNPWSRTDPMGLSWDPFSIVDDYIAEDAGSKAAFLERIVGGAKTAAYVGSVIMSVLPFPVSAAAGELGMAALEGHVSPELQMAAKIMGYASLGAASVIVGKIAYSAAKTATQYVMKYGMRAALGAALKHSPIGLAIRGAKWAARKLSGKCGCFAAGTLVWTTSGLIPIESVQPGVDQAITLNEATGLLEFHAITDLIVTEQASLLRMTVIHESGHHQVIDTTDEHPFYEESRIDGWVRADSLSPGDIVRTMSGAAIVDSLSFGNERTTVYNLTVESAHTYMVGPDATWVHNTECKITKYIKENSERIATGTEIDKVNVLVRLFGGKPNQWRKKKGRDEAGNEYHWYEKNGQVFGAKHAGDLDPF